jgi:uncharacterized protein
MMYSLQEGQELIALARETIQRYFSTRKIRVPSKYSRIFTQKRGAFVTLTINDSLRGCIGFTEPAFPLAETISKAAVAAAFSDPRFPPMSREELSKADIEVSVLTVPQLIEVRNPEDYLKQIQVGRDGLIAVGIFNQGLLLPQVAVEYGWDVATFLSQTCMKAGMERNAWMNFDKCRIYRFSAQIFSEKEASTPVAKKG